MFLVFLWWTWYNFEYLVQNKNCHAIQTHHSMVSYYFEVNVFFLLSCWLLQLNVGEQGEHLTSQVSWLAAWILFTLICPVYLVEEHCYFGVIYLSLGGWWVVSWKSGKVGRVVSWRVGKVVWGQWVDKVGKVGG